MTVYIESNFVLEQALQQEESDSCNEIALLASDQRITLVVPAFSLVEPHQVVDGKEKARSRLSNELGAHLNELGRSKPHRDVPASFDSLVSVLIASAQFQREGLRQVISELLRIAEVIPLSSAILKAAMELQREHDMSGRDSIVLASVLEHLNIKKPSESCFLNRNSKDFDDPNILERLAAYGCKFFPKFGQGLGYILKEIRR